MRQAQKYRSGVYRSTNRPQASPPSAVRRRSSRLAEVFSIGPPKAECWGTGTVETIGEVRSGDKPKGAALPLAASHPLRSRQRERCRQIPLFPVQSQRGEVATQLCQVKNLNV